MKDRAVDGVHDSDGLETDRQDTSIEPSEIHHLAYHLWERRGCPDGSPEEDWFEAERELKGANTELALSE